MGRRFTTTCACFSPSATCRSFPSDRRFTWCRRTPSTTRTITKVGTGVVPRAPGVCACSRNTPCTPWRGPRISPGGSSRWGSRSGWWGSRGAPPWSTPWWCCTGYPRCAPGRSWRTSARTRTFAWRAGTRACDPRSRRVCASSWRCCGSSTSPRAGSRRWAWGAEGRFVRAAGGRARRRRRRRRSPRAGTVGRSTTWRPWRGSWRTRSGRTRRRCTGTGYGTRWRRIKNTASGRCSRT
mmetsp:Transcript_6169/g.27177  ORF Transcript_6169/g.27177 Transcript_6169/m.27177 type:complete len:238 (+) Transcript_6169:727-1440(+)